MLRALIRLRRHVALLAALLALIVAAGAWAPAFARLVSGPPAHACHCEVRSGHADCACAICFPELTEVETFGHASLSGTCGDGERGTRTPAMPAVLTASFVVAPPTAVAGAVVEVLPRPRVRGLPAPEEPPRASS